MVRKLEVTQSWHFLAVLFVECEMIRKLNELHNSERMYKAYLNRNSNNILISLNYSIDNEAKLIGYNFNIIVYLLKQFIRTTFI